MKKLIFFFIILLAAVWVGLVLQAHPGYVLISVGDTRIESTFWFALLALIILFVFLHWFVRLLHGTYKIPARYMHWRQDHDERKAQQLMQQATHYLLEGSWRKAEKTFLKAAKKHGSPLICYMGAAKTAQAQKDCVHRDYYLQKALVALGSKDSTAIGITRARWQLESGQVHSALETLTDLQRFAPNQPLVLNGLKDAYLILQDWESLGQLLPKLQRHDVMDPQALPPLQQRIFVESLRKLAQNNDRTALEKFWKNLPKHWRRDPAVLTVYCADLIDHNEHKRAEDLLKMELRHTLSPSLLAQYARILSPNPARHLLRAEIWLRSNPDNADLLFCLGQLCVRHRLWGKARTYFEASIKNHPQPAAYLQLGQVLEELGDKNAALRCYCLGLEVQ